MLTDDYNLFEAGGPLEKYDTYVKNTTGTTSGTIRNMGVTSVAQTATVAYGDAATTQACVLPAGSMILRVGIIHDWKSNWCSDREFARYLGEDIKIREHINKKLSHAGLSDIHIRKDSQKITIDIYTARPGIVIGKSGVEVDAPQVLVTDLAAEHEEDVTAGEEGEVPRAPIRTPTSRSISRRFSSLLPAVSPIAVRLGSRPRG
mgnify:CR=1 FL=1